MLGLRVTIPIACFRKGLAREYLETEPLPPPSTCYGFLLSLMGETKRERHIGCRIAPVLVNRPERSVVLRTVWRRRGQAFLLAARGRLTLPVWVDHVGSADTRYVTGDLVNDWPIERQPELNAMPRIEPLKEIAR